MNKNFGPSANDLLRLMNQLNAKNEALEDKVNELVPLKDAVTQLQETVKNQEILIQQLRNDKERDNNNVIASAG